MLQAGLWDRYYSHEQIRWWKVNGIKKNLPKGQKLKMLKISQGPALIWTYQLDVVASQHVGGRGWQIVVSLRSDWISCLESPFSAHPWLLLLAVANAQPPGWGTTQLDLKELLEARQWVSSQLLHIPTSSLWRNLLPYYVSQLCLIWPWSVGLVLISHLLIIQLLSICVVPRLCARQPDGHSLCPRELSSRSKGRL